MMGDRARVLSLINAAWTTQVVAAACELRLPDRMAAECEEAGTLARRCGAHAEAVHRLLRAMVALGLCEERSTGRFALTDDGAVLCSSHPQSLGAWARFSGGHVWRNWAHLARSVASGASARPDLEGTNDFGFLDADAGKAAAFNAAMADLTRPVAEAAASASAIPWSGTTTFVDVGGGVGALAAEVLRRHAHLRGIVFDLAHAAEAARQHLERAGVADRCQFVTGSFFERVPAEADVYLLKSILHDWDDERAGNILARCREAMPPHGRVLILERIVPERISSSASDVDVVRSDLNMLVGCGGRERTLAEFERLLRLARLRLEHRACLANGVSVITASAG